MIESSHGRPFPVNRVDRGFEDKGVKDVVSVALKIGIQDKGIAS